jgi:very-short-patch-repair endonuclease
MPDAPHVDHLLRGKRAEDREVAVLAARQHGVVARAQLLALGLTARAIDGRLARGWLHPVHRGVFAVGVPARAREALWMAAVLSAGEGAVLSHRSAAALWGLRPDGRRAEVSVPGRRRPRAGVRLYESPLPADEVTVRDGIAVTTVARTLLDLAAVVPAAHVERAINEAEYRRLGDAAGVAVLLARHPRRRGAPALRAIADVGARRTRSDLEAAFLALVDAERLPRPGVNALVEGFECDAVWRGARLIVELDGHAAHGTREAFERDRARDRALTAAGWRVLRMTARAMDDPAAVARDLRALVA